MMSGPVPPASHKGVSAYLVWLLLLCLPAVCSSCCALLLHSRKVIGYLYAINKGAQVVYDADDGIQLLQRHIPMLTCNQPLSELTDRVTSTACQGNYTVVDMHWSAGVNAGEAAKRSKTGAVKATAPAALFNPYPMFGQPHVCPRGIHPATLADSLTHGSSSSRNGRASSTHSTTNSRGITSSSSSAGPVVCFRRAPARPLIQQGLINGRPDIDRGYHGSMALDVAFERHAFSVVVPPGTGVPINRYEVWC